MIEKNKITRAEYLIFKYVEDLLLEIRVLNSKNLAEAINLPAHGLNKDELLVLLWQMFERGDLVAHRRSRGYFSPTYNELEKALNEHAAFSERFENTFYGYISAASERYNELKSLWEDELLQRKS